MPPNLPVFINPADFDRRVREPRQNTIWTVLVIGLTESGYVAITGLTGIGAYAGAVAIGIGGFFVAGWLERSWRRFHTVPREMLIEKVSVQQQELSALHSTLDKQRRTQHVADVLTEKHAYCVHEILNGYTGIGSSPAGTFDEIVQRDKSWVDDLLQTMRELGCSKQEVYSVETLGTFPQLPLTGMKRANVPASMVKARLDRLQKVIDKYAGA